jgi:hypothetical protein
MSGLGKYHSVLRYRNQCEIDLSLRRQPKFSLTDLAKLGMLEIGGRVRGAWMAEVHKDQLISRRPRATHSACPRCGGVGETKDWAN